ncbi:MAG: hypothetical protein JOZ45_11625 [Acidobacteriaceae bacterium]|nr:hypothetical protein [Acidobacteriaceae bacterium]
MIAALDDMEAAQSRIDEKPNHHPFTMRYKSLEDTTHSDNCETVLNHSELVQTLQRGWKI